MMDHEQEGIFYRARLRRERIAVLRRRRAIGELRRQIDFETMWADPRARAVYDHRRRIFYQLRPHLYEPVPKMFGRRALRVLRVIQRIHKGIGICDTGPWLWGIGHGTTSMRGFERCGTRAVGGDRG